MRGLRARGRVLGWGLAIALVGLLVSQLEVRSREVERRFVGVAAAEPYLAAARTLRRMGVDARLGWPSPRAPDLADTVLVRVAPGRLGTPALLSLLDWAGRGGRLVLALAPIDDAQDPDEMRILAGSLAVQRIRGERPVEEVVSLARGSLLAPGAQRDARVRLSIASRAVLTPLAAGWETAGGCFTAIRWGAGVLALACDASLFASERLGENDHAAALWYLTVAPTRAPTAPVVRLISRVESPGLLTAAWEAVPLGLVALGLLLALGLAAVMPRLGPILEGPEAARRSILEHIAASGWFLWRRHETEALLAPLRAEVARLEAMHRGGPGPGPGEGPRAPRAAAELVDAVRDLVARRRRVRGPIRREAARTGRGQGRREVR